ncbi:MAG: 50S ribosomal protein L9 [Verrucomicrobia bacterium]|nr:50S ribosomal protein L9 [Verrucomicrobiota bacterium]
MQKQSSQQNQLLLLKDVDSLGRKGDVVRAKPGYARNFLIPQQMAVVADKFTLRMQAKLKEERAKQAEVDRKDAEALAQKIDGKTFTIEVKVDPDGHMYGSVSTLDIVRLLEQEGFTVERRNIVLAHPIKTLGVHALQLKLKEGVPASITLKVMSDIQILQGEVEQPPAEPIQE